MDDHGFDALSRAFAARRRRRAVLGLLLAGLGAARTGDATNAQVGSVPLGGSCFDDVQCAAGYVCRDNGFVDDGPANCCGESGAWCDIDEHCCGGQSCVSGVCGATGPAFSGPLPIGAVCDGIGQCDGGGFFADCADNGFGDDGPRTCCLINGQVCFSARDCCGAADCIFDPNQGASFCAEYPGGFCLSDRGCVPGWVCLDGICR